MKKKTSKDGKVSKYKNHNKDEKYDEKSLKINKKMNCTKEKHGKNKNENTNNPLNDNKNERIHKKREAILEEVIPAKIIDTYRNNRNQNMNKNVKNESVRSCISCFCCGWDADDEAMNELLLEEEREKLKLLEEERKRLKLLEEEEKERERLKLLEEEKERERLKLLEEEKERERLKLLEEEEEEKKRLKLLEEQNREEQKIDEIEEPSKDIIFKKKEIKPKFPLKKKANLNFIGAAAAPNPPKEASCIGPPPQVKETNINVKEGIYLIYNAENDGQLEVHYSKSGKKGSGVMAYIMSDNIPDFYFDKNKGKEIIFKEVSKKMQSVYINDLKPYYECYIEFMKMKKTYNGVLYFLPAFNEQPPPNLDIGFFDTKEKKLNYVEIEKPVEFTGNYLFVIQKGLDIFKKEINVEALLSYLNSYGSLLSLS
ncbi:hypothetical protein PFMG_00664 [Plasmodium falciparum IGH-CR14]|uniref:IMP1-like protein, putative n=4 Tax=Plasmodium falciparum TaxID=5833 RepID=Q8IJY0_PLAF7|nr:IMP1-like protein, putative [Plasmodium falciparum 3D7]ETW56802.1 hypothetical protein PFUGPA_01268 [Plasmodium falciparum Palo Alto/Uganda]EWC88438.1 hypothetical protein PFNF54_02757 [Plasmodium falciparum NF54]KNG74565.1 hypothetical protein PFMG_00664 [Plasmodium falciparum IGH-CR14]KAF4328198.1 IMP1-like protein [Plasmodium falciparum NF54]PKC43536.1 IMP1-like protein [Plasmodium falciparum NF54]|eukprot:XP_001347346.1 conserved Plasmodium protein, unknown function [Plasmodium falciparum 3D7]